MVQKSWFIPCYSITFNFNCIFHNNYALDEVLSRDILVLMFFTKSWSGVHRWEYPHYVHIVHSTLITFSTKITLQSQYDQGAFSSQYLSRNSVVCRCEYPYPHCATMSHSTLITLFMKIMHWLKFYQGAFRISAHQGIMLMQSVDVDRQ
jgi:hypothetical protein